MFSCFRELHLKICRKVTAEKVVLVSLYKIFVRALLFQLPQGRDLETERDSFSRSNFN